MSNLRNSVRLLGNLGQDPDVRELKSGKKMAKFSMSNSETYRNDD